jgi:lysophospholipase L1-like esterase
MELSVAQFLAAITPAPAAFVVDCSWNMNATSIAANAVPLVRYLRDHGHPETPIVLAEGLPFGRAWAVPDQAAQQAASNAALAAAFQQLAGAGDQHLHYVSTDQLFGPLASVDSATANGLHPTDAGMHDMAALWIFLLSRLLG